MVAQAEEGDAHSMLEEYRGYILDGGSGHPGGHIRLDPARKEILVEVDRAAVINNLPGPGNDTNAKLKTILNGASGVFSNATRGAGIYMYWLMDEVTLDLPKDKMDTPNKFVAALATYRDTVAERATTTTLTLKTDFIHFLVVDQTGFGSASSDIINELPKRGSMLAVTDVKTSQIAPLNPNKLDERLMITVAHEITHVLFNKISVDGFDDNEHTSDANLNGTPNEAEDKNDIMYTVPTPGRAELATVKIFPMVQIELRIRTNRALVLNPV